MNAFIWLVLFCAALAAFGWVVSRITGARAHFLENWPFLPWETVQWRDDRTDVMVVPRWGGAAVISPIRTHRWSMVATDRRVILANRSLTGKRMVMYVLWFGSSPDPVSRKFGAGLLTRGYQTMAVAPVEPDPAHGYIAFRPVGAEAGSFNVKELRVYTIPENAIKTVAMGG